VGTCCIPTCIVTHACVIPASTHDSTRELPGLKGVGDGRGVSTSICLRVVAVCLWNVKNLKRKSQRVRDTDLYPFNVSIIIGNEKKPTKSRVYHPVKGKTPREHIVFNFSAQGWSHTKLTPFAECLQSLHKRHVCYFPVFEDL